MLCPRCQRSVDATAAFCGNCGFRLSVPAPAPLPPPEYQPAIQAASPLVAPPPVQSTSVAAPADRSALAIASFVLGVLGLPGCLIPIVGIVLGILAIVFGTLSVHSRRKVFAIIGMVLAVIVLLVSIFMWVQNTKEILDARKHGGVVVSSDDHRPLQAISTPCYTTKVPDDLKIIKTKGSCTFLGNNTQTKEQEEVKVMQVPGLSSANLATAAKADAANVVNTIAGGEITKQSSATFAGSQAYAVEIKASDGSAALISYVYNTTAQGNLTIVLHTQAYAQGSNYSLSSIERNWSWL